MKNHTKEEQEQVKLIRDNSQGKSTDTSQEGWLDADTENPNQLPGNLALLTSSGLLQPGMYEFGASFDGQLLRQPEESHQVNQEQYKRGKISKNIYLDKKYKFYMIGPMVHQPNSLDSLDGEAPLPFDPVPIRFDAGNKR